MKQIQIIDLKAGHIFAFSAFKGCRYLTVSTIHSRKYTEIVYLDFYDLSFDSLNMRNIDCVFIRE